MPLIIPTNSISAVGYDVANSLRFDGGSSDYLSRTPASSGTLTTWTYSCWVKRSKIDDDTYLLWSNDSGTTDNDTILINSSNVIYFNIKNSNSPVGRLVTNQVFRDTSAWYHLVFSWDTTNATSSDRMRIYVNGERVNSFSTETQPSLNTQSSSLNANKLHLINETNYGGSYGSSQTDLYLAEVCFIDGTALDQTSFGEFDADTGIWKPIDVSELTFGTNGFYLPFENSGALGQDDSGNGNNFTVNNLTSIDQTTDTPTNNFCTFLGELEPDSETSHSDGNTKAIFNVVDSSGNAHSSIAINNNGKWYAEFKISATPAYGEPVVGINDLIGWSGGIGYNASRPNDSIGYLSNGNIYQGGSLLLSASSFTNNDIIQVAFDGSTGRIYFGKNGTWQNSGDPSAGTGYVATAPMTAEYIGFAVGGNGGNGSTGTQNVFANFGNPAYSANGYSDANGYGNMSYSVPSGYYILNTKNLAEYG